MGGEGEGGGVIGKRTVIQDSKDSRYKIRVAEMLVFNFLKKY